MLAGLSLDDSSHMSASLSATFMSTGSLQKHGLRIGHAQSSLVGTAAPEPISPAEVAVDEDQVLGRGAGGFVARGFVRSTRKPLAVKVVRAQDRDLRAQLMNDVNILLRLSRESACLIDCFGAYVHDSTASVHVVLEYMEYGSLTEVRRHAGPLPALRIPQVLSQIVDGLKVLHEHSILHRDIKCGNVLVNASGAVKVTDFGIAKLFAGDDQLSHTYVGTAIYMSPERVAGEDYSFPADVWSFGMVAYELSSDAYPYAEVSSFTLLYNALHNEPEPRLDEHTHSAALCDFVAACLKRDPTARCTLAQLSRHELLRNLDHGTTCRELACWLASVMPEPAAA